MSTDNSVSTSWAAKLNAATAIISLCLLVTALYGYGCHWWKMSRLPQNYIRLIVSGSSELCRYKDNLFTIQTETPDGQALSAQIHFVLTDSDGATFLDYRENTDSNGMLTITVERNTFSDERLGSDSTGLTLFLEATTQAQSQKFSTFLPLVSGERSVSGFMKESIAELIADIDNAPCITENGTQFEMIPAEINNSNIPAFPMPGTQEKVQFYPEGGRIIADLENRVWIWVKPLLKQSNLKGFIVDENNNLIEKISFSSFEPKCSFSMACFTFIPKYNTKYAFVLADNQNCIAQYPRYFLPTALRASRFTAIIKNNVINSGESMDFSVYSNHKSLPLIVQLQSQGEVFYRMPIVTQGSKHSLSIPIPEQIQGLVQVSFFDCGLSKPTPTIQSWIYCKKKQSETTPLSENKEKVNRIGIGNPNLDNNDALSPEQESGVIGIVRHALNSRSKLINTTVSTPFIYDNFPVLQTDLTSLLKEYYKKSHQTIISTANAILTLGFTLLLFVIYLQIIGLPFARWGNALAITAALLSIGIALYLIHVPQAESVYQTFFTNWTPGNLINY